MQATEMEKKIPHEEKDVKRVEENPSSKPSVDVGVNTRKNAWHSAPFAPHVANETITQTSAEVNHKKRKDIVRSKKKLAIQKTPE